MSDLYFAILKPFIYIFIFIIAIIFIYYSYKIWNYKRSDYYKESGNSFFKTFYSKGNWGEYELFKILEELKGGQKIMTNLYLPKKDGTNTEVDLLMIHKTGIYVFESKNYSGWIFGSEKNKIWTQTMKNGSKHTFYNPIWQNKGHISALDSFLNKEYTEIFYSYIVFSERCELKKMRVDSDYIVVTQKNHLLKELKKQCKRLPECFTQDEIEKIYKELKPQTRVDDATKREHIAQLKKKYG